MPRCRAYVGHLKRLFGSGAKALSTNALKGALRSVVCGAVMTSSKAKRFGFRAEATCAVCGLHNDTIFHRAWECTASEGVRHEHASK